MHLKQLKFLILLLSMIFITACSNTKVSFDYDSSADFSQVKTYKWNLKPSYAFAQANPLIHKRIIFAIEENLSRKGLTETNSADIEISYSISLKSVVKTGGLSAGIGMSVGKNNRGHVNLNSGNRIKQSTEGSLLIDMTSIASNELIWRSTTVKSLSKREATPEDSKKRIGQAVYRMFEDYPPNISK